MKLAAIDIGSNSIHLVVARALPGQRLEIIDREKEMVRLGSVTLREHRLSEEAIERALKTLRRFKQLAEANRVDLVIATATAAVRESHNADEFIRRARDETGVEVQLLPGIEEARLIALAVSEVTDLKGRRALVIDIGGGSTEFIVMDDNESRLLLSVRLGAIRLTEKFVTTDPISDAERERLVATIRADLSRVAREVKAIGFDFVIGTSGTILDIVQAIGLEQAALGTSLPPDFEAFSRTVTLNSLKNLNRRLASMTVKERRSVPGIDKGRADIIIPGALLLETILVEVGANAVSSCDWSLREGVILDYLRKSTGSKETVSKTAPPFRDQSELQDLLDAPADVRTQSVLSVARRYEYDVAHSHHVAHLATRIFDGTKEIHDLGPSERRLLQYAAILHDIGYHIAHNNHHRHALYLIKNSEMPGFAANEIAVMAALVRYHRGSMPKNRPDERNRNEHDDFLSLMPSERSTVLTLASILQIADGFDRSHTQIVRDVRCVFNHRKLSLLAKCDGDGELDLWSAMRKTGWFSRLFSIEITIERK
jgi:exopolyphosphatase/guanosine-5'-triphosphate,3'-diphosphate pyrophosphatase